MSIKFNINKEKALEAVVWLTKETGGATPFFLSKFLFFADKLHIERYGRPVIGDRYIAMAHGPVPSFVYDLLKCDGQIDKSLLDKAASSFSKSEDERTIIATRDAETDFFSETDIECLSEILHQYGNMTFRALWDLGHENRGWQQADRNSEMDYELIIDEDIEDRDLLIEELQNESATMAL